MIPDEARAYRLRSQSQTILGEAIAQAELITESPEDKRDLTKEVARLRKQATSI